MQRLVLAIVTREHAIRSKVVIILLGLFHTIVSKPLLNAQHSWLPKWQGFFLSAGQSPNPSAELVNAAVLHLFFPVPVFCCSPTWTSVRPLRQAPVPLLTPFLLSSFQIWLRSRLLVNSAENTQFIGMPFSSEIQEDWSANIVLINFYSIFSGPCLLTDVEQRWSP